MAFIGQETVRKQQRHNQWGWGGGERGVSKEICATVRLPV